MAGLNKVINIIENAATCGQRYIDLKDCKLVTFPPNLGVSNQKVGWQYINVQGNSLRSIPIDIGFFQHLKEFNAEDNNLQTIPVELAMCQSLEWVDFDTNPNIAINDPELWKAYMSGMKPRDVKYQSRYCQDGRAFGPLKDFLRKRIADKYGYNELMQMEQRYHSTAQKLENAATRDISAFGRKDMGEPFQLFNQEYGANPPPPQRPGRANKFDNMTANRQNVNINEQWGSAQAEFRPKRRQGGAQHAANQIDVMETQVGPVDIRYGKRVAPRRAHHAGVVGKEWGEMTDSDFSQVPRPVRRVYDKPTNLVSNAVPDPNAEIAQRRVLRHVPETAGPTSDALVWDENRNKFQQPEPPKPSRRKFDQKGGIDFANGAYNSPRPEERFNRQKKMGDRPPDSFALAPTPDPYAGIDPTGGARVSKPAGNQWGNEMSAAGGWESEGQPAPGQSGPVRQPPYPSQGLRIPEKSEINKTEDILRELESGRKERMNDAITTLRQVVMYDYLPHNPKAQEFKSIIAKVGELLNHPDTNLSMNAIHCVKDLYSKMGKKMGYGVILQQNIELFLPRLLTRAAKGNQAFSDAAMHAIVGVSTGVPPKIVLPQGNGGLYIYLRDNDPRVAGWACYGIREALLQITSDWAHAQWLQDDANLDYVIGNLLVLQNAAEAGVRNLMKATLVELARIVWSTDSQTITNLLRDTYSAPDLLEHVTSKVQELGPY